VQLLAPDTVVYRGRERVETHPLRGVALKLNRAEDHLQLITDMVNTFIESDFYETAAEKDSKGRLVARLVNVKPPPPELSVLIGDCVHNFRSALDHLAYALAASYTAPLPQAYARTSAFPIFRTGPLYRRTGPAGAAYKMRGMSRRARAAIQRLQPYHRRKRPGLSSLWMLEELSNIDKHRLVHLTGAVPVTASFRLQGTGFFRLESINVFPRPIVENAIAAHFYGDFDLYEGVEVEARMKPDVVFDRHSEAASVRGESVMLTLLRIRESIVLDVLPELEWEFGRRFPGTAWRVTETA
jgi:hypothetical protein